MPFGSVDPFGHLRLDRDQDGLYVSRDAYQHGSYDFFAPSPLFVGPRFGQPGLNAGVPWNHSSGQAQDNGQWTQGSFRVRSDDPFRKW